MKVLTMPLANPPPNFLGDLNMLVEFFETMSLGSCSQLHLIYATDAWFKDPFNEVQGLQQISAIYTHMFEQVDEPRFVIHSKLLNGNEAFLSWDFHFKMKRHSKELQCIRGATHLRFNLVGRVEYHRDYWDAAEELYEKIPLLGSLMRTLKRYARG